MIICKETMKITYINNHLKTLFNLELVEDLYSFLFKEIIFKVLRKRSDLQAKSRQGSSLYKKTTI